MVKKRLFIIIVIQAQKLMMEKILQKHQITKHQVQLKLQHLLKLKMKMLIYEFTC